MDEEDHAMDINETNMQIEASQVPLPTDDSDVDDDTDTDDDLDPSAAAENEQSAVENQAVNEDEAAAGDNTENNATGGGIIINQEVDPTIRAILGDLDVPEGVDPSFLAALPQEMRDEVIQEHLR